MFEAFKRDSVIRRGGTYRLRSDGVGRVCIFGPPRIRDDLLPDPYEHPEEDFPRLLGAVEAEGWIAAKAAFGLTLTDLQRSMNERRASFFDITGHCWGEDEFAPKRVRKVKAKAKESDEELLAALEATFGHIETLVDTSIQG